MMKRGTWDMMQLIKMAGLLFRLGARAENKN